VRSLLVRLRRARNAFVIVILLFGVPLGLGSQQDKSSTDEVTVTCDRTQAADGGETSGNCV